MYRVILIDDEILVREAIKEKLDWNSLGYELAADFENGKDAIEFLEENTVDVVLTDICMPYVDGIQVCKWIYEKQSETAVIIFSGFGEFSYAKEAIRYGVSEYMLKPVTSRELTDVLGKVKEKLDVGREKSTRLEYLRKNLDKYRKHGAKLQNNAIAELLGGVVNGGENLRLLEESGLSLDSYAYRAAIVNLDMDWGEERQYEAVREKDLISFAVYNISAEIVSVAGTGQVCQENSGRTCILFETNTPREFRKRVSSICRCIQDKVEEFLEVPVSVCVGPYVRNAEDLHLSYKEAERAFKYGYLYEKKMFLDLEDCKEEGGLSHLKGIHKEELQEVIKANDQMGMRRIFQEAHRQMVVNRVTKSQACMYLVQLTGVISQLKEQVGEQEKQDSQERILEEIAVQPNLRQAVRVVEEYAREVGGQLMEMNTSAGSRQARMAVDYIIKNYNCPDLNLNQICAYLSISISHFSTIFKEETGVTFKEFLIKIRMEKAKELLENTTLRNYEIAEKVGFSDFHYFGIAFKKMTGKTPTEYAKEIRKVV